MGMIATKKKRSWQTSNSTALRGREQKLQLNHSRIKTPIHHRSNFVTSSETQQLNPSKKKSSKNEKYTSLTCLLKYLSPGPGEKHCRSWREAPWPSQHEDDHDFTKQLKLLRWENSKDGVEQAATVGRSLCTNKSGQLALTKQNCAHWKLHHSPPLLGGSSMAYV